MICSNCSKSFRADDLTHIRGSMYCGNCSDLFNSGRGNMAHPNIEQIMGQFTIDIPGNGINQTGIDLIQIALLEWGYDEIPENEPLPPSKSEYWKWDWKVPGKGEYVGSLPKRIGKLLYQMQGVKIPPHLLSKLGNIGSQYSGKHCKYWFDIVNTIDWEKTDFGQPDTCCFWSCHAGAKEMIVENGGGAIRFFDPGSEILADEAPAYTPDYGFARAWLAPWRGCWIVFNGYGLETLTVARILATHMGHAYYRRIHLTNLGSASGELWVNGPGAGFLIGPQEQVLQWESVDLKWEVIECAGTQCGGCGEHFNVADMRMAAGEAWCSDCFDDACFTCEHCDESYLMEDMISNPDGGYLCDTCWEDLCFRCTACGEVFWQEDSFETPDVQYGSVCEECLEESCKTCAACGVVVWKKDAIKDPADEFLCEDCWNDRCYMCCKCDNVRWKNKAGDVFTSGGRICWECRK